MSVHQHPSDGDVLHQPTSGDILGLVAGDDESTEYDLNDNLTMPPKRSPSSKRLHTVRSPGRAKIGVVGSFANEGPPTELPPPAVYASPLTDAPAVPAAAQPLAAEIGVHAESSGDERRMAKRSEGVCPSSELGSRQRASAPRAAPLPTRSEGGYASNAGGVGSSEQASESSYPGVVPPPTWLESMIGARVRSRALGGTAAEAEKVRGHAAGTKAAVLLAEAERRQTGAQQPVSARWSASARRVRPAPPTTPTAQAGVELS